MGLGNDQKEREEKYAKLVKEMNLEEGYDKLDNPSREGSYREAIDLKRRLPKKLVS